MVMADPLDHGYGKTAFKIDVGPPEVPKLETCSFVIMCFLVGALPKVKKNDFDSNFLI